MLSCITISEIKQATNLILEKIRNLKMLGKNPDLDLEDDESPELHYLINSFNLNGSDYKIPRAVFSEIIKSLETKGLIKIDHLCDRDVTSYFKNPELVYEFVADFVREDPKVNVKELMKDCVAFFRVSSSVALEREIGRFKLFEVTNKQTDDEKLSFDANESALFFKGKRIEISRNKRSDSHYLLIILFKDTHKVWSMDEIWDEWRNYDTESRDNDWHKFYNACRLINTKIATETKIKKFLTCSSTEIRINKEYL